MAAAQRGVVGVRGLADGHHDQHVDVVGLPADVTDLDPDPPVGGEPGGAVGVPDPTGRVTGVGLGAGRKNLGIAS